MAPPDLPPLSGLRGLEHVGLTVPDMTQALDFLTDVLGAEVLYELGPVRAEDNWMAVNLGVAADAVITRLVMVRIGRHGPALELFEYEHPEEDRHPPPQNAAGGQHLAFYVEDIDAGVEDLRRHGIIALGEPKRITEGPSAGLAWVHFLAPWGQQLELVSYPSGIAAYADREPSVWTPGDELRPVSDGTASEVDAEPDRLLDTDGEPESAPA